MMVAKRILFLGFSLTAMTLSACGNSTSGNPFNFGSNSNKPISTPINNSIPNFDNMSDDQKEAFAILPKINSETNTLTYGLYPQSAVTDKKVATNIDSFGNKYQDSDWYYFEGNFYVKAKAYTSSGSIFNDGTRIETYQSYWFKCEPIKWNILKTTDEDYLLLSSFILDSHLYFNQTTGTRLIDGVYVKPNNYEHSLLRSFLDEEMSSNMFRLSNNYLKVTNVDNSSYSTAESGTNSNACNNTNDKVFVLSRRDMLTTSYGFSENVNDATTRRAKVTDWAKATGMDFTNEGYGDYWTRSPNGKYTDGAYAIAHDGVMMTTNVNAITGVRPAIILAKASSK